MRPCKSADIKHNEPWVVAAIKLETEQTRKLLRQVRHIVEQGHVQQPPNELIAELGRHAALLAHAISQFTLRCEATGPAGSTYYTYEDVPTFVTTQARLDPSSLLAPVVHPDGADEKILYREELGFSEQEYKDLVQWKQSWDANSFDMKAAFDEFASKVVSDLQAAKYSIKIEDVAPGVAGLVGIAVDVVSAVSTGVGIMLVSSCATGIAAIAAKFPDVH
jgi:hypothetical protein